jgi:CubicO group peptidase (beta-lactamase class C family)
MYVLFSRVCRTFATCYLSAPYGVGAALLLSGLLGAARPTAAQVVPMQRLDSLLMTLATHDKLMSSVTLSHAGQVVYSRAFGCQRLAPAVPATPATRYLVGSVTKMFTAVLIFQLLEEKKRWLPRWPRSYRSCPMRSGLRLTNC